MTTTKRKPGPARRLLTPEHVKQAETLAGYGLTFPMIAHALGFSETSLKRRVRETEELAAALDRGRGIAQGVIAQALFTRAKGGDITAIIWWEKTRAGRTDRVEVTGNGAIAPIGVLMVPTPVSAEEWARAAKKHQAELAAG